MPLIVILKLLLQSGLWAVAGMDLMLLLAAAIAARAAIRLQIGKRRADPVLAVAE